MPMQTDCPFVATFEIIRGKWTNCIVTLLATRPHGFNEILRAVPEISPKVLAERLKQLERDAVIVRRVLPTNPPSSEYSLGRLGTDLVPLIVSIERWGRDYL